MIAGKVNSQWVIFQDQLWMFYSLSQKLTLHPQHKGKQQYFQKQLLNVFARSTSYTVQLSFEWYVTVSIRLTMKQIWSSNSSGVFFNAKNNTLKVYFSNGRVDDEPKWEFNSLTMMLISTLKKSFVTSSKIPLTIGRNFSLTIFQLP